MRSPCCLIKKVVGHLGMHCDEAVGNRWDTPATCDDDEGDDDDDDVVDDDEGDDDDDGADDAVDFR